MNPILVQFFKALLISGPLLLGAHLGLNSVVDLVVSTNQLAIIHGLIFGLTALVFLSIGFIFQVDDTKVGFAFLASVILKMFIVIAFFFLYFKNHEDANRKAFILNFFVPYFFYLALEAISVFKELNKRF